MAQAYIVKYFANYFYNSFLRSESKLTFTHSHIIWLLFRHFFQHRAGIPSLCCPAAAGMCLSDCKTMQKKRIKMIANRNNQRYTVDNENFIQ